MNKELNEIPQFPSNCLIDLISCCDCKIEEIPEITDTKVINLYLSRNNLKKLGKFNLSQT